MSVDILQEKIRKTKSPVIPVLEAFDSWIPQPYRVEGENGARTCEAYYRDLLEAWKGVVPGVRFGFSSFALRGGEGLAVLAELTKYARALGYYVLLDAPEFLSPQSAANTAQLFAEEACPWAWDGLVISPWLGSDGFKPFLPICKEGKSLFCLVRSGNKSAPELQDLLSGGRHVHTALADIVYRQGEGMLGKSGYSNFAAVGPATSADSLRALRLKYPRLFLLLDGFDYSFGNAKNCSLAFDRLGHGAAVCAGASVVAAWTENPEVSPVEAAVEAANRVKKNLGRYITVL